MKPKESKFKTYVLPSIRFIVIFCSVVLAGMMIIDKSIRFDFLQPSKVTIGHASASEYGDSGRRGAIAGDQTGREVYTRKWYDNSWTHVIRAKDPEAAEKIAVCMEQACANDHIGYDQTQRTTLSTRAQTFGWDLSLIKEDCETDCSALVAVCVNAAGIEVSLDMYTGNEVKLLEATGAFDILTDEEYAGSWKKLKRGDILYTPGHTAVVLSDGSDGE